MYYRISNNPGVELPATGGPGTHTLYMLGCALIIFAAAALFVQRNHVNDMQQTRV